MKYDMKYDNFDHTQTPLKEIVWDDDTPIINHSFVNISPNLCLYHTGNPTERRFSFCAAVFCSGSAVFDNVWDDPDVEVEILCSGVAYFDGIRHLWMPYWNYANCADGVKLFQTLAELQQHYNVEDA